MDPGRFWVHAPCLVGPAETLSVRRSCTCDTLPCVSPISTPTTTYPLATTGYADTFGHGHLCTLCTMVPGVTTGHARRHAFRPPLFDDDVPRGGYDWAVPTLRPLWHIPHVSPDCVSLPCLGAPPSARVPPCSFVRCRLVSPAVPSLCRFLACTGSALLYSACNCFFPRGGVSHLAL